MHNVPDAWCNHFRGDVFHDAKGHYYQPTPEQVRQKYREPVPMLGFHPLPDSPRLRRGIGSEREAHRQVLSAELARVESLRGKDVDAKCVIIQAAGESFVVPRRVAPSFLYAARVGFPDALVSATPDEGGHPQRGRFLTRTRYMGLLERAMAWLS